MSKQNLVVILGPTASGKTTLATALACLHQGEIISADSRQVYRGMTIGTGKDLKEYNCKDRKIPYHLIDIVDPGYEYNVYEFQKDFLEAYNTIVKRGTMPIMCGGTGMYLDSILERYPLIKVDENKELRKKVEHYTHKQLIQLLISLKTVHNTTDLQNRERLIRAIEIADYEKKNNLKVRFPAIASIIFGISLERKIIRQRISQRLKSRIENGMIEEVEELLQHVSPEKLIFYGLEYKYLTLFVTGKLSKVEMYSKLETAIHQFAKRQMTWFRRMERRGNKIHWIDGLLSTEEQLNIIHTFLTDSHQAL
jgi:tRNA dimethylallyltransferase